MKKNKIFLFAAMMLSVFFSCTKEPVELVDGNTATLRVSLENGKNWEDGDVVLVNGTSFAISGNSGTPNATLAEVPKASEYLAAYDFGKGSVSDNVLTLDLPKKIIPGQDQIEPMVAYSDSDHLMFKHLLGFLKLKFSGDAVITKLNLTSNDPSLKLSGEGVSDLYFVGEPRLLMTSEANANITLDFGAEGLDLSAGEQTVVVPLPPAKYEDGFHLLIYDADGKAMETTVDYLVEIKRGESKTLPLISYTPGSEAPFELKATLENDAEGHPVSWQEEHEVTVNGTAYPIVRGNGTATAVFGPVVRSDFYVVVSPANAYSGFAENLAKVKIPANQSAGASLVMNNPQAGVSTSEEVELHYVAGVISVKVSGNNILDQIQLVSIDKTKKLSGAMDVVFTDGEFTTTMNNDGKPTVSLKCGGGISTEGGKEFFFVVPAGNYPEGFRLVLTNKKQQMHSVETGAVTVTRNVKTELEPVSWTASAEDSGDLSAFGWANCYIVTSEGKYSFDTKLTDGTPVKDIASVDWLWANSVKGNASSLISNISYKNGKVTFDASAQEGNVLLAAFNAAGEIVWSWHIWMTDEPQTINTMNLLPKDPSLGYFLMDRNLGATSAKQADGEETYGFFYQWGRKDPFYGGTSKEVTVDVNGDIKTKEPFKNAIAGTVCNTKYSQAKWQSAMGTKEQGTIDFSIKNPMFFLAGNITSGDNNWLEKNQPFRKNYDQDLAAWRPFEKTIYDPCPVGYQIPRYGMWNVLEPKSDGKWVTDWSGFIYTNPESGESTWFPAQGIRVAHPDGNGALSYVDAGQSNMIGIWTSEQMSANPSCRAYSLNINTVLTNSQAQDDAWGYGLNVRCVKIYEYTE